MANATNSSEKGSKRAEQRTPKTTPGKEAWDNVSPINDRLRKNTTTPTKAEAKHISMHPMVEGRKIGSVKKVRIEGIIGNLNFCF
jgi:hypothetical protein